MDAQTTMLQAQIDQLKSAIALTQAGISKTEQYEKIGKPSMLQKPTKLNNYKQQETTLVKH